MNGLTSGGNVSGNLGTIGANLGDTGTYYWPYQPWYYQPFQTPWYWAPHCPTCGKCPTCGR